MRTEYDSLAGIYDYEWGDLTGDIEFVAELAAEYGAPILELASGTGRITIPLAERGFEVTGIDNSEEMLKICEQKMSLLPDSSKLSVQLGDMSDFSLGKKFKFIFVPFNSFLLLSTKNQQERCLKSVYNHLDDEGCFMVDVFSPDFKLCAEEKSDIRFLRHFYYPPEEKVIIQWEYVERNMAEQVLDIDFLYEAYNKDGKLERFTRHLTMALIFRFEMQMMLEKNGFEVIALYGDHKKSPFISKSPQMIFLCKKR
ncbi:class I SAM-dependent DNA methyltransferase [candidate division KSB1 bacterium]